MARFTLMIFFICIAIHPVCTLAQVSYSKPLGSEKLSTYADGKVEIRINAVFNGIPLKTDKYYVNQHGDTFYVDGFRFYMTNVRFTGNKVCVLSNSHLFDIEDTTTASYTITNVPAGNYSAINFVVGVDSIANTSGANSGDLDPAKGMYWAWNSGYIMAKLEGHSSVCKTLHHAFEFHIGGYMPPYNTARMVTLKLTDALVPGTVPVVTITADVSAWFTDNLDLAKANSIMIPGKDAALMADKYAKMFSASLTPTTR